jgi:hypothetical protein
VSQPGVEAFDSWIRSSFAERPFYISGHRFEKTPSGRVTIDRGSFELEEAMEVGHELLSINPVLRFSAKVAIWEKNGTLVKVALVVAILLLILVILVLES